MPDWTEAEYQEYISKIPPDETPSQMRARAWKGPVPPGVPPNDQTYICPVCGDRTINYRPEIDRDPGPAIIQPRPARPGRPPRICCNNKDKNCYAIEWEEHSKMCAEFWAGYDAKKKQETSWDP